MENPGKVIKVCNDLAARGFPHLKDFVEDGQLSATANLLRSLSEELAPVEEDVTDASVVSVDT
jgi:hypothetical protein